MKEQNVVITLNVPKTKLSSAMHIVRHALTNENIVEKKGIIENGLTLCSTLMDTRFLVEKSNVNIKITHLDEETFIDLYNRKVMKVNPITFTDYI